MPNIESLLYTIIHTRYNIHVHVKLFSLSLASRIHGTSNVVIVLAASKGILVCFFDCLLRLDSLFCQPLEPFINDNMYSFDVLFCCCFFFNIFISSSLDSIKL